MSIVLMFIVAQSKSPPMMNQDVIREKQEDDFMNSLRVQSLHALTYCERLFSLEEVERIRLADAAVYAGRRLHVELEREEEGEWHTLDLESETLGLRGRVDCLRRRDGSLIPYEHKRGRAARKEWRKNGAE